MTAIVNEDGREPPGTGSPRLPTASPLDPPSVDQAMPPARPISPEVAALLPPVGLLSRSRTPPPLAVPVRPAGEPPASPPSPMPAARASAAADEEPGWSIAGVASPVRPAHVRKRPAAGAASSAVLTLAMVVTAVGVGAMAIIPALRGGDDSPAAAERSPRRGGALGDGSEAGAGNPIDGWTVSEPLARPEPIDRSATDALLGSPGRENAALLDSRLAEVVQLLGQRDTAAADDRLEQLATGRWSEAQYTRIQQHSALASAVEALLTNLREAIDGAGAGRTIPWRGREVPIVGVTDAVVTILVDRRQVRLRRDSLSNEAVRALAEGLLDMADPRNQAQLGAFLFVAEPGNRIEVRRLWTSAAAAGEDVSPMLALLASSE